MERPKATLRLIGVRHDARDARQPLARGRTGCSGREHRPEQDREPRPRELDPERPERQVNTIVQIGNKIYAGGSVHAGAGLERRHDLLAQEPLLVRRHDRRDRHHLRSHVRRHREGCSPSRPTATCSSAGTSTPSTGTPPSRSSSSLTPTTGQRDHRVQRQRQRPGLGHQGLGQPSVRRRPVHLDQERRPRPARGGEHHDRRGRPQRELHDHRSAHV